MKFVSVVAFLAAALAVVPATAFPARPPGKKTCHGGVLYPVGTATAAYAALVKSEARVFRKPGGAELKRFAKLNENGYPTTFGLVGAVLTRTCAASWYRVKLPMRPNGIIGYVRPADVLVHRVTAWIDIDLSARQLRFFTGRKLLLKTPVAVGSPATPTPVGRFYVNQRIIATNPSGPYGPAALGVSAFSNVLTGWAQGGPIGIHGTNAPWSIGRAVSNGCIRVPNGTLKRLFSATIGGEPVVIHP
ncbi:MAG TPA: L,D-transpeptidase [Gaiellaceae bacterium]|nr:L,D-transpeptidase [Gaiellaceae bacterium]